LLLQSNKKVKKDQKQNTKYKIQKTKKSEKETIYQIPLYFLMK